MKTARPNPEKPNFFQKIQLFYHNNRFFRNFSYTLMLSVWVFSVLYVAQIVVAIICSLLCPESFLTSALGNTFFAVISYVLALVVTIFLPWKISKKQKTSREELGLNGLPTWTDIGLAPIGYIVATLLGLALVALFTFFPWFNAEEVQDVGYNYLSSGFDRIVAFFMLVVFAPIAEEIIFRGWFYGKLRKKLSFPLAALIVSLIFGLAHGQWNVGINVFALSIVLCSLREITGTIYSGILVHMLKNGIVFYLLYVLGIS